MNRINLNKNCLPPPLRNIIYRIKIFKIEHWSSNLTAYQLQTADESRPFLRNVKYFMNVQGSEYSKNMSMSSIKCSKVKSNPKMALFFQIPPSFVGLLFVTITLGQDVPTLHFGVCVLLLSSSFFHRELLSALSSFVMQAV